MKAWEITATRGNLKLSYNGLNDNGEEIKFEGNPEDTPGATAVEAVKMYPKKVAVTSQNMTVNIRYRNREGADEAATRNYCWWVFRKFG